MTAGPILVPVPGTRPLARTRAAARRTRSGGGVADALNGRFRAPAVTVVG